ncbi:MAG: HAMP domain-containing histidine kinase [Oscillospiraceae bacterium]|nr:HAMP domain-containing histidine kinase [Oscillospiraceae bacterium]
MLLVVILICVIVSLIAVIWSRTVQSLMLLLMNLANIVMMGGVVIYIAQMGGLAATAKRALFLSADVQRWLRYLPISFSQVGYTVAIGRMLLPFFLCLLALKSSMLPWVRRHAHKLIAIAAVFTALFLIYYYPPAFRALISRHIQLLRPFSRAAMVWIIFCVCASLLLLLKEYIDTSISVFRRNFGYMVLSVCCATVLYLIYATKDPAQIYNQFITEYLRLGFTTYISASMTEQGWDALLLASLVSTLLGGYGALRYTRIDYDENKEEILLQRKFDAAGMGISVFVHSVKNQLLASRMLHRKLEQLLAQEPVDLEQVRSVSEQLQTLNEEMLARMDQIYRVFKDNALTLTPVTAAEAAELAVQRFHSKYPDGDVHIDLCSDRSVLADSEALGEALYNLLINGYEAALGTETDRPQVTLRVEDERLWTAFRVQDNGGGIPKRLRSKIFEPFYTSKNADSNWGMGLYYARKIAKGHLGHLRLERSDSSGTVFLVMLPLYDAGRGGSHGGA